MRLRTPAIVIKTPVQNELGTVGEVRVSEGSDSGYEI
jgi:hypothetical protein